MEVVVVLGASSDSSRYSFKAVEMLKEFKHFPIPVHPKEKEILGLKVFPSLGEVKKFHPTIDTLTIYLRPEISSGLKESILEMNPKRVIFNPGAENPELEKELLQKGVKVENACTLVLLRTHQF